MDFQDSWWNISVSSLAILAAAILRYRAEKTDKHTDKRRCNPNPATTDGVVKYYKKLTYRERTARRSVSLKDFFQLILGYMTADSISRPVLLVSLPHSKCLASSVLKRWKGTKNLQRGRPKSLEIVILINVLQVLI